jgi:HEAT repeat protein
MCDTLGQLGDRRAVPVLLQFLHRVVDVDRRQNTPKRADNLPSGDEEIPGSILYAAAIRACGLLGDHSALNDIVSASNDFDPYVRVQALEAIKRLDPQGEDARSRIAVRTALNDPREKNIQVACQLVQQYRDIEAASVLQQLIDTRPALSGLAYETLRRLT